MSHTALRSGKKKPIGKSIPDVPERILSGEEPLSDLYMGDWQPVTSADAPVPAAATSNELQKLDSDVELFLDCAIASATPSNSKMNWLDTAEELMFSMDSFRWAGQLEARETLIKFSAFTTGQVRVSER
jgi:hypothetical protein